MAFMGPVPPSVRPWPDDVHALIDAQHAEIARVLGLLPGADADDDSTAAGTIVEL